MYEANKNRYNEMVYRYCGKSGLKLPVVSLGMWHNFGSFDSYENAKKMVEVAFDHGVTHLDLANNYGPVPGSAEETLGRILKGDMKRYRDELVISSKAGYYMWEGPYGEWGSKKYLTASLDQSLKRMGLDYVDIFYHHRPDPDTPLEETMDTLAGFVQNGKALYVGISNYNAADTKKAVDLLAGRGVHCLIHQMKYSMLVKDMEPVFDVLDTEGVGGIAFSPLAQGLLSDKYLKEIPSHSRAAGSSIFLSSKDITPALQQKLCSLNEIAAARGQSLAQMALAYVLDQKSMASVLIGASTPEQIVENCRVVENLGFSVEEKEKIEACLRG